MGGCLHRCQLVGRNSHQVAPLVETGGFLTSWPLSAGFCCWRMWSRPLNHRCRNRQGLTEISCRKKEQDSQWESDQMGVRSSWAVFFSFPFLFLEWREGWSSIQLLCQQPQHHPSQGQSLPHLPPACVLGGAMLWRLPRCNFSPRVLRTRKMTYSLFSPHSSKESNFCNSNSGNLPVGLVSSPVRSVCANRSSGSDVVVVGSENQTGRWGEEERGGVWFLITK